jgi:Fe-S cluster assembly ATP-binding protein
MLEIKNLSAGVVENASLRIADGARHLLRGANGSGKTTIASAVIGNPEYEIKSGKIILDGTDITKMPTAARAKLGLFAGMQSVPEIPGLSVMTFLKHSHMAHFGDAPMGEFISKMKAAGEKLDIPDSWLGRSVNVGFSGGEKKRLMFLHMMLIAPKMAVLDEPDSGADRPTQSKFAEIIDAMKETTFLIISHSNPPFFKPTDETEIGAALSRTRQS